MGESDLLSCLHMTSTNASNRFHSENSILTTIVSPLVFPFSR